MNELRVVGRYRAATEVQPSPQTVPVRGHLDSPSNLAEALVVNAKNFKHSQKACKIMLECNAEGKQPCGPRAPARTVLSAETLAAARDSAVQDHLLVLDLIGAAEDTAQSRMANHIGGSEAAMAGRKRMPYGHAGWSPYKHCKHEWPGVNPTALNASIDTVPHPPVAKKSHKACGLCEHKRRKSTYKDCGGSSICEHQRQRSRCKDCGKDCGGSGLCEHQRQRSQYAKTVTVAASASTSGRGAAAGTAAAVASASTSGRGATARTAAAAASASTSGGGAAARTAAHL